jgi:glycosyltransferase involved in cell wall biosynthesis
MKICIISHEYPPFPAGGISTYHDILARYLSEAGHEVHVITNNACYGAFEPQYTQRVWTEGNLIIHRLPCFREDRIPEPSSSFFDINPSQYGDGNQLWAYETSNLTAHIMAEYFTTLHAAVGFDVIESPEYFAEAFYIIRQRRCSNKWHYPPVCIVTHTSTRISLEKSKHIWQLGSSQIRNLMLREDYCIQFADALQSPSRSLLQKYEDRFNNNLPGLRIVLPNPLEAPENAGSLPPELRDGRPFLLCVGRIEPRKGSDIAAKAFAYLADEFPDLKLVFLGREAWRAGESFADVLTKCIPRRHMKRILRLGNVPREQVFRAAREAVAFLHPAPWDNYPYTVLEAMHEGATCIVSDQGGHCEMIEDGRSGLVTPADDPEALANAIGRVLKNSQSKENLSRGARERARKITDKNNFLERKVGLFSAMIEKENREKQERGRQYSILWGSDTNADDSILPGEGIVVLDAEGFDYKSIQTTIESVQRESRSSIGWNTVVLLDPDQTIDLPEGWERISPIDSTPWMEISGEDFVIYLLAGTRMHRGCLISLIRQVQNSPLPCGSFLWLRAASSNSFPYRPDSSFHDLMLGGGILPPAFAVKAAHLQRCPNFAGLEGPSTRLCALMTAAATDGDILFQHTGDVCGEFCGELPQVNKDVQIRATGYLAALHLVPRTLTSFGNLQFPGAMSFEENSRFLELQNAYNEHQALKQMLPVRLLRKLGVLSLIRRIFPQVKKAIGSG